jgi:predicted nucleic acid-binding protein
LILFQDTDSICKLYLDDEERIEEARQSASAADVLAASSISYAEVKGVLARARNGRRIRSQREYARVSTLFEADWRGYFRVGVSDEIIWHAGQLAEKHGIKGVDAVVLASAVEIVARVPESLSFSTWDSRLSAAAIAEGLSLAHEVGN